MTAHHIVQALCDNDIKLLRGTYAPFLMASISKFHELRPKASPDSWRFQPQFNIAAAPLMDLLDISGYAKLMSEFHKDQGMWAEVVKTWDAYLKDKETHKDTLQFFAACVSLVDRSLGIPFRGITRTSWKQQMDRMVDGLPKIQKDADGHGIPLPETQHDSLLVRVFAGGQLGSLCDGIDIFVYEYFGKAPGAEGLSFGGRRERFGEQMQRRNEAESQENDSGGNAEA